MLMEYFFRGANPTVDLVVYREGKNGREVLLIQRKSGTTEGGKWAIPGGFIDTTAKKGEEWRADKETPLDAALRELEEETGLKLTDDIKKLVKPVGVYEGSGRDPRDNKESWSKSHAFTVVLPRGVGDAVKGLDDASDAKWFPVSQIPKEIAFDHAKILAAASKKHETPKKPSSTPIQKTSPMQRRPMYQNRGRVDSSAAGKKPGEHWETDSGLHGGKNRDGIIRYFDEPRKAQDWASNRRK